MQLKRNIILLYFMAFCHTNTADIKSIKFMKLKYLLFFTMIIVRIWYTLTSMPRKFDINQYPKTFILYTPLQTFNFAFNFLDSAFVSSDGKWKIDIFYTEINDITEYSKNYAPWWNYFCNIQIKKKLKQIHIHYAI